MSKNTNQPPVLKDVVANKRTYAYALIQGKSVWIPEKGYNDRVNKVQIGSIKSLDGLGECEFNVRFLSQNPEFIEWRVFRVGTGKYEYKRRDKKEIDLLKAQVAASQDIIEDIKNNPTKPGKRTKASVAKSNGIAFSSVETPRKFGDLYLLQSCINNMLSYKILKKILPENMYNLLIYIIMTALSKGIKSITYELESFLLEHGIDLGIKSYKDAIQRLYKYIEDNGVIEEFAKEKALYISKKQRGKRGIFLALDGTNVDNAGNCLTKAQYGKSKSGSDNKIINFITLVDQATHELFATMSYAGNVTDVLTVESVCNQLTDRGINQNISLVCDRGYWSVNNISTMLEHNISFLFNCNISRSNYIKSWVDIISRQLIRDKGEIFVNQNDFISKDKNQWLVGTSIKAPWHYIQKILKKVDYDNDGAYISTVNKETDLYIHFVFSHRIYEDTMNTYRTLVKELNDAYMEANNWQDVVAGIEPSNLTAAHVNLIRDDLVELYNNGIKDAKSINSFIETSNKQIRYCPKYKNISKLCRQTATRVLVSDSVDNVVEANERYAQRNNVEVGYSMIKGELGGSTLNASTNKTVNSKIFILALATEMQRKLIESNKRFNEDRVKNGLARVKLEHNSVRGTLRSLESIEAVTNKANGKINIMGGLLKKHSDLLSSFGVKPLDALTRASYATKDEGFSFKSK